MIDLSVPVADIYPATHWAVRGEPPGYDTPDEDVYLVGRNVLLLAKAAILSAQRGIGRIALGPLAGNPFPDARPAFFAAMADALSLGLDHPLAIARPFETMHKDAVIALGVALGVPFELTLSCMNPGAGGHCGACSKCRERQQAFAAAGVPESHRHTRRNGERRRYPTHAGSATSLRPSRGIAATAASPVGLKSAASTRCSVRASRCSFGAHTTSTPALSAGGKRRSSR